LRGNYKRVLGLTVVSGVVGYSTNLYSKFNALAENVERPPPIVPSREIRNPEDKSGLKITLYQFQTCPFCCKVRAYLDHAGFNYDVVEVNSVRRTEVKWTKYKKVPIVVIHGIGKNGFIQVNDSSVIISLLESFLLDKDTQQLDKLVTYYPSIETTNDRGKPALDWPNKYFIMYNTDVKDTRKEERKWRKWTDEKFIHMISPNVYRTPRESWDAFQYFSEYGQWEKHFSTFDRYLVLVVGTIAMWGIAKMLKKRHKLKDDVRESLYDHGNQWMKALGKRKFMGGDKPNLADLAFYGSLTSFEGCLAFKDLTNSTKIGDWYYRTKKEVVSSAGVIKLSE